MPLTTAEMMAVEVLRGDLGAARALADYLVENIASGGQEVLPVRSIQVDRKRVRVVLFVNPDAFLDESPPNREGLQSAVDRWLEGVEPLALVGIDRIEIYELPEKF
jgi:hypothetical protein